MEPTVALLGLSTPAALLLLLVAVALVAFFSASEAALLSASRLRLRHRADGGSSAAQSALRVVEQHDRLFGTILTSENLCIIAASALGTALAIRLFGSAGVLLATVFMSVAVIVFGEITPKTFAASHADAIALLVAPLIEFAMRLLRPVVWLFGALPRWLLRQAPSVEPRGAGLSGDELRTLVRVSRASGGISATESEMLRRVLELRRITARDLMTPRTDLVATTLRLPVSRILATARQHDRTRILVYGKDFDDLLGYMRLQDLLSVDPSARGQSLRGLVRPVPTVATTLRAAEIPRVLAEARSPMAVVVDEYGGTAGIVTATDVWEEITGHLPEGVEESPGEITAVGDGWTLPGDAPLREVNEKLGTHLPEEKFRTLAGYLLNRLGRIPSGGEQIQAEGIRFTVEEVKGRRILSARATKAVSPSRPPDSLPVQRATGQI